jgi:hypothetical protein
MPLSHQPFRKLADVALNMAQGHQLVLETYNGDHVG